ncbi:beta-ketoacyl synthase [Salinibius halmophilus]|uniref:beta-ketoacyl synthase n=1 Tax=Salinibius halmophilus TaxID=1853216 RepID=UPI000E66A206|nr:beta-ketoacyl synthase [Salinibius halmophilus]
MAKLPVIVSFGGINAAGRSSFHHSYKRMVHEKLSAATMANTWQDLANKMQIKHDGALSGKVVEQILAGTLVRKIEPACFDYQRVPYQHRAPLKVGDERITFALSKRKLPNQIPDAWQVEEIDNRTVRITTSGELDVLLPDTYQFPVSSAGQIPAGFDPGSLYNSRFHPRGLKLTVYGASDALNAMGIDWADVLNHIKPDEVSVYAGSALAQVDDDSLGGLISAPYKGGRASTKMMALSLAEMPADFINSYLINSVGATGTNMGACASFLYNLRQGLHDIKAGRARVAIIGNAEAPVVAEVMEGFRVMGALAQDDELNNIDGTTEPNNRRACRPFSENCGFTMAESAQFVVLMDDELALALGANIHGSVPDVFINADANKKSISAPGVGNWVTMAKATALAEAILGRDALNDTFVQAHGTGTPQNRVTESSILNEVAKHFGIQSWPVAAVKSYVGHSMGAAAGDQLVASLGVWQYGLIPGIKTIDHIASDVHQSHLNILQDHLEVGDRMQACILNSKGFGGNNASALVLSPAKTKTLLQNKHGEAAMQAWLQNNESVAAKAAAYDSAECAGEAQVIYQFGESVMDDEHIELTKDSLKLSEFTRSVSLTIDPDLEGYL